MEKSPGQETGFGNRGCTFEGSEWYQIGPKWAWMALIIILDIPKLDSCPELFCCLLQQEQLIFWRTFYQLFNS